ncbi:hypothetical protein [Mycobacterium intracellulare]|uniref:hypothetical protein n=1 Tax=Mycobacterium intracellulare TaxID=1767 RepID=UPI0014458561|nr:hypothetical protein [Mycobacterium intracellulare]
MHAPGRSFGTSAIVEALTVLGVRDGFEVEGDEDREQFIDELPPSDRHTPIH